MTATWCLRHNSLLRVQREVPPEVTCVMKVEEEKKTEMGVEREKKGEGRREEEMEKLSLLFLHSQS